MIPNQYPHRPMYPPLSVNRHSAVAGGYPFRPVGPTNQIQMYHPAQYNTPVNQLHLIQQRPRSLSGGPYNGAAPDDVKKMEESRQKKLQYQQQKMKLQSFATTGTTKLDADQFIANMFGTKTQVVKDNDVTQLPTCDTFGEFHHASFPLTTSAQNNSYESTRTVSSVDVIPLSQPAQVSALGPEKDLTSFMLECSDLSAPSKAKPFKRPTLNQVHRKNSKEKEVQYHQSEVSRDWKHSADSSGLEGLFVAQDTGPQTSILPPTANSKPLGARPSWLSGSSPLPPVYNLVKEACIIDRQVSTERLYPVLLMSGLSRQTLSCIWSMVNKTIPGQLTEDELIQALAIIALVQKKVNITSLGDLLQYQSAPVPTFTVNMAANQQISIQNSSESFMDFQRAKTPEVTDATGSKTSFNPSTLISPTNVSGFITNNNDSKIYIPSEEQHSNVRNYFGDDYSTAHFKLNSAVLHSVLKGSNSEDDYVDRCSSELSESEDFRSLDTYISHINQISNAALHTLSSNPISSISANQTIANAVPDLVKVSTRNTSYQDESAADDFCDFKSAERVTKNPGHGDLIGDESDVDKYSFLKGINEIDAMDSVFGNIPHVQSQTATSVNKFKVSESMPEDEWADFKSVFSSNDSNVQDNTTLFSSSNVLHSNMAKMSIKRNDLVPAANNIHTVDNIDDIKPNSSHVTDIFNTQKNPLTTIQLTFDHVPLAGGKSSFADFVGQTVNRNLKSVPVSEFSEVIFQQGRQKTDSLNYDDDDEDLFDLTRGIPPPLDDFMQDFGDFQQISEPSSPAGNTISTSTLSRPYVDKIFPNFTSHSVIPPFHEDEPPPDVSPIDSPKQTVSDVDFEITSVTPNKLSEISLDKFGKISAETQSIGSLDLPPVSDVAINDVSDNKSLDNLDLKLDTCTGDTKSIDSFDLKASVAEKVTPISCNETHPTSDSGLSNKFDTYSAYDRYSALTTNVMGGKQYERVWLTCLEKCLSLVNEADLIFGSINDPSVCDEVVNSAKGNEYIAGLLAVHEVVLHISSAIESTAFDCHKLVELKEAIDKSWQSLLMYISLSPVFDIHSAVDQNILVTNKSIVHSCGLCLLGIPYKSANHPCISYAGQQYHAACANLWVNHVDSVLPQLRASELNTPSN